MATVRILVRPSGCYNGLPWPAVGETLDLPDGVAKDMADVGHVEVVQLPKPVEKRPASSARVEKRSE